MKTKTATQSAALLVLFISFLGSGWGCPFGGGPSGCGSSGGTDDGSPYDNLVAGTVTYANGVTPIAGAYVAINPSAGERIVVMSGNLGEFKFDNVPDGLADFIGEKGPYHGEVREVPVVGGKIDELITLPLNVSDGGFCVVPGDEDDITSVIDYLGYAVSNLYDEDLTDEGNLEGYQLLFLASGSDASYADDAQVQNNLKSFVSDGGYLYVSDKDYFYVKNCWPDKVSFIEPDAAIGESQTLTADVVDAEGIPSLGGYLRKNTAEIYYRYENWAVIDDVGADTTVLLEGDPRTAEGQLAGKPLLVYFEYGAGVVVYTSFGYDDSATDDALKVFEYIISLYNEE
ncbi:MAG: hypothetical protein JSW52_00725 [Candidatus Coatesbacteria bacterium]|nr:MAG: hypothetical protein JSW52_00725 [Candidatus Coatesbacteria bacterium]